MNRDQSTETEHLTNRRTVLRGVAAVGGVGVLAACGGGSDDAGSDAATGGGDATASESPSAEESSAAGGTELGPTSDVLVAGGAIYPDQKIVVTQPTEGDFRAFTAVCTHNGCLVSEIVENTIVCTCHNSAFSLEDGSVVRGPASEPLAEEQITVEGDTISLA